MARECGAQKRHAQQEIGARVVAELDDRLAHVGYRHGARGQVLPGDRRIVEQIRRGIVPCAGIMGGERDGKTAARYAIMLALNNTIAATDPLGQKLTYTCKVSGVDAAPVEGQPGKFTITA